MGSNDLLQNCGHGVINSSVGSVRDHQLHKVNVLEQPLDGW